MKIYINYEAVSGLIERTSINQIDNSIEFEADEDVFINPDKYKIENGTIVQIPQPEDNVKN